MNTPVLAQQVPYLDVEPRLGQSDLGILAWIQLNVRGGANDRNAPGLYAKALYKLRPKLEDDPAGYAAWNAGLTDRQRKLIETAMKRNDADPKVQAKRERERQNLKALRKSDPAYQKKLSDERAEYAAMIKAKEGREVRPYVKGRTLTKAEKDADQKLRTAALNAKMQDDLAAGRNPYDIARYRDYHTAKKAGWEKMVGTAIRQYLCDVLLATGSFDAECSNLLTRARVFCDNLTYCSGPKDDSETRDLIIRAISSFRAAGIIQRKGDIIRLHDRIIEKRAETDQIKKNANLLEEVAHIPGAGAF